MDIKGTKNCFIIGQTAKGDFIDQMSAFHRILFDFSLNLSNTEISRIEIEDNAVIFTSRATDLHPGNVKFNVDGSDIRVTPLEAFNFNQYEKEDSEMLYKLVADSDVIFDIGANIGWYTNHLSKKMPDSKIYSFEPIPDTYAQLKKNTQLNNSSNVILNNFALSDAKKTLSFYYSPSQTGASSSVNITENANMIKLECETNTIDNFIAENNIEKLDFIKCDVEGAELLVYSGGIETFKKHIPIVFTEMLRKWAAKFDYHPNDIIKFFDQFGYKCYISREGKLELIDTVTEDTHETNFFFLHPKKHANHLNDLS